MTALSESKLLEELDRVSERLAEGTETGEQRLALLRRQAELGDLRDAILRRAKLRRLLQ
jgi:hypothetical protein